MSQSLYKKLLSAAYGFYIVMSAAWLITSFAVGGYFNYISLITLGIFSVQAYYRHRVANLALGIILLPASILGALFFLSWGGKSGFDSFIYVMLSLSVVSLILSIFLVFSYLRLSFNTDSK